MRADVLFSAEAPVNRADVLFSAEAPVNRADVLFSAEAPVNTAQPARPPGSGWASRRVTERPAPSRCRVADSPARPAPMTAMWLVGPGMRCTQRSRLVAGTARAASRVGARSARGAGGRGGIGGEGSS